MRRRATTAASTILVALLVALAVPVSQLKTLLVVAHCCCPDATRCHCPDHKPDHSTGSSMRACHRTVHEIVSPDAPQVDAPIIALADAPRVELAAPVARLGAPHAAPAPARPDAPS